MSALTDVFTAIANAIRGKNGLSTTYTPSQMAQAITAIPSGGEGKLYAWSTSATSAKQFAYTLSEDPKVGDSLINGWSTASTYKTVQAYAIAKRVNTSSSQNYISPSYSPSSSNTYYRNATYDITMIT